MSGSITYCLSEVHHPDWRLRAHQDHVRRLDEERSQVFATPLGEAPKGGRAAIDYALDDAFGQRIVSNIYTPQNQYHLVLVVLPKYQFGPDALNDIYVTSSAGQQVPLRTLVRTATKVAPIQVNHQGQFPSVTISFNLVPGASIGQALNAIDELNRQLGKPLSLATSFQGNAQAFTAALSSEPILIAAAVFVIHFRGKPLKKLRRSWRTACDAIGLSEENVPHTLRHTAAT